MRLKLDDYRQRSIQQLRLRLPEVIKEPNILPIIEYSLFASSKLLRPLLIYFLGHDLFNLPLEALDAAAGAIELMHTFSLIHDDLPAMDNDRLRRGKLASHLQFDEASAILAGDGLAIAASRYLMSDEYLPDTLKVALNQLLTKEALAMIEGQWMDLHPKKPLSLVELDRISQFKTAAMISFSAKAVAIIAKLSTNQANILADLGLHLGMAFQIQDDLLDYQQAKTPSTVNYVRIIGLAPTKNHLQLHYQKIAELATTLSLDTTGYLGLMKFIKNFLPLALC